MFLIPICRGFGLTSPTTRRHLGKIINGNHVPGVTASVYGKPEHIATNQEPLPLAGETTAILRDGRSIPDILRSRAPYKCFAWPKAVENAQIRRIIFFRVLSLRLRVLSLLLRFSRCFSAGSPFLGSPFLTTLSINPTEAKAPSSQTHSNRFSVSTSSTPSLFRFTVVLSVPEQPVKTCSRSSGLAEWD